MRELNMRKCYAKLIKKQQKYNRYQKIKQVSMDTLQVKKKLSSDESGITEQLN